MDQVVFIFARAGVLALPVALDFTSTYIDETVSLCWKEISRNMWYYSVIKRFTLNFSATFAQFLCT
ncbi:hypothetical protein Plhal304r1_c040g0117381 [Plasmopara halstedii]